MSNATATLLNWNILLVCAAMCFVNQLLFMGETETCAKNAFYIDRGGTQAVAHRTTDQEVLGSNPAWSCFFLSLVSFSSLSYLSISGAN